MVKLRNDYIIRIFPEELDTLTIDDRLYVETGEGQYVFYEKMQIQTDEDNISFIHDDRICVFDYDDIKMYKVREKPQFAYQISGEISGFEDFVLGLVCGVILMIIMFSISGVRI